MLVMKKRKSISVTKKAEILKYIEKNLSKKQTEVVETFELSKQTLNNIVKQKSKIVESAGKCSEDRKKFRSNNYEDVVAAMILWFKQHY